MSPEPVEPTASPKRRIGAWPTSAPSPSEQRPKTMAEFREAMARQRSQSEDMLLKLAVTGYRQQYARPAYSPPTQASERKPDGPELHEAVGLASDVVGLVPGMSLIATAVKGAGIATRFLSTRQTPASLNAAQVRGLTQYSRNLQTTTSAMKKYLPRRSI